MVNKYSRAVAWSAYLLALTVTIFTLGLPTDRIYQATWIVAGLIAFTIDRPWRDHVRVVWDWLPLIAALVSTTSAGVSPTTSGCPCGRRNW